MNLADDNSLASFLQSMLDADDPAAQAHLADLLRRDPATRQAYLDLITTESLLHRELSAAGALPMSIPTHANPATGRPRWRRRSIVYAAAAAVIILAVGLVIHFGSAGRLPVVVKSQGAIAVLTGVDDAVFAGPSPGAPGSNLSAGPIDLTAGNAQIMFDSTAVVDLVGPCRFAMTGRNRGSLTSGALHAYVPARARGFNLDLPHHTTITDLGTEFDVVVDARGDCRMSVLQGRVGVTTEQDQSIYTKGQQVLVIGGRLTPMPMQFAEALDGPTVPLTLERVGPGGLSFAHAAAIFAPTGKHRLYLRTCRSDWFRDDFVAEVTVTIPQSKDPWASAFIGMGPGDIEPKQYDEPFTLPNVGIVLRADLAGVCAVNNGPISGGAPVVKTYPHLSGTHRLRMTWDARKRTATFAIDFDNSGRFVTLTTLDAAATGFTPGNACIFFGGGAGIAFDHFSVHTSASTPTASGPAATGTTKGD